MKSVQWYKKERNLQQPSKLDYRFDERMLTTRLVVRIDLASSDGNAPDKSDGGARDKAVARMARKRKWLPLVTKETVYWTRTRHKGHDRTHYQKHAGNLTLSNLIDRLRALDTPSQV